MSLSKQVGKACEQLFYTFKLLTPVAQSYSACKFEQNPGGDILSPHTGAHEDRYPRGTMSLEILLCIYTPDRLTVRH